MNREQMILQLQQEYQNRREENQREFERRQEAACARCDGLKKALQERREALMNGIRGSLLSPDKRENKQSDLPGRMTRYNRQIAALLRAGGLPEDALAPVYTCPVCKDEGYVYSPGRHMCACMEKELNLRALRQLGFDARHPQTFEAFREEVFTDEEKPSQRGVMRRNRAVCERYANEFPHTQYSDLLLIGQSGLGKTFLLQSIAARVVERGYTALYISAYRMQETARKSYFENNPEPMRPLLETPLLLLDDLGTEPLMENITIVQLFNLLNERQLAGLHTVLSTNLTIPQLKERYTERVASRLLDSRQ
ncbi:MAG: hypothetical protein EOM69_09415, partial [Clostridia bacterium]|nr:hypothetical protein [Clostridia bacterium]